MKKALILFLFVSPLCAQQKKHVQTEAQKCWSFVQTVSVLDLDHESANFDSLSSLVQKLSVCSETLKADKFKSATALNLENLLLTLRDKRNLQQLNDAAMNQYRSELAAKAESDKKLADTTALLRGAISAYTELSDDYQRHLASDIAMSAKTSPPPSLQAKRGYWASVLQGMSDAAQAEASKPTIHCTTSTVGVNAETDCR